MDFIEQYPRLEPSQRDHFQRVVTRLLSGAVLTPGPVLNIDPDWRFAERHRELIDSYLRLAGWRFDIDLGLRIGRAIHEMGSQRVRFSKMESLVLCMLRLCYHEQMRLASEQEREITVGELRERLVHAGRPVAQLSPRALAHALRRLARYSLVQIGRGFEAHDDDVIVVTAIIEKVLPPERIREIEQRIREYTAAASVTAAASPEDDAEETAS